MRSQIPPNYEMSVDEFKAWLSKFDADGDGSISRDELRQALRSLHTWFGWWKTRQVMKDVDTNNNGRIDNKELEKLVNSAQQHLNMKINESGW
ncbi:hypothetical protein GIB67_017620 [Kingdonia uniflora]|uniref:EF-hand domain-containing protein n=1 Tax=Kingdonia uniflora TaxID=39325 RepID=A0A7J7LN82_9MAGN|nr:hypothetical protein GIB67_017620 [Kingdonia uniflora]